MKGIAHEKIGYVVKILLYLLEKDKPPTVMELLEEEIVPRATFYNHLRHNLEKAGLVVFRINPDRTITAHLTEDGRRLAKALKSVEDVLKKAGII